MKKSVRCEKAINGECKRKDCFHYQLHEENSNCGFAPCCVVDDVKCISVK